MSSLAELIISAMCLPFTWNSRFNTLSLEFKSVINTKSNMSKSAARISPLWILRNLESVEGFPGILKQFAKGLQCVVPNRSGIYYVFATFL